MNDYNAYEFILVRDGTKNMLQHKQLNREELLLIKSKLSYTIQILNKFHDGIATLNELEQTN